MRVKLCGITNKADALMAVSFGADAVGFLIGLDYATDDEIDPSAARDIVAEMPPFVSTVLVTHRTDPDWVVKTAREIACTTVQIHGEMPIEVIPSIREALPHLRVTRVVHVTGAESVERAATVAKWADAVHLDTLTHTRVGGTGVTHDWSISARIVKDVGKPVILSGGLTPDNVRRAITTVQPFAVDVNSGVETPDGRKSAEKMRCFIGLAKGTGGW